MSREPLIPPPTSGLSGLERLRLVAEIAGLYVRARWNLRVHDLPTAVERLRGAGGLEPSVTAGSKLALGRRLGVATARTLGALPADDRCLARSLVLTGLLSRRGIGSRLVIAVHPGEQLAAHAWVEYDGKPLLEPAEPPLQRLTEL